MNKFIGIGYLGKKGVDLKFTQGTGKSVATYSLSIPRQFTKGNQKEYDFLNIVTWGNQAEWLANNQDRIKQLLVEGRVSTRSYDRKDGTKAYITEITTEHVEVIEWKDASSNTPSNQSDDEMTPVDDGSDNYIPF